MQNTLNQTSSFQKRLFAIWQKEKKSTAYNMPTAFSIQGKINFKKLQEAYNTILNCHGLLKMNFVYEAGELKQIPRSLNSPEIIQKKIVEKDLEKSMTDCIQPFDLETGVVHRLYLLEKNSHEHILLLDMHHIIGDAASSKLFFDELFYLYQDQKIDMENNEKYNVQEPYFVDQGNGEEYWRNKFDSISPELKLNIAQVEKANSKKNFHFARLSEKMSKKVNHYCQTKFITPNILFLSALYLTLYRFSGETDMTIGSVISTRDTDKERRYFGPRINTLPLRLKIEEEKKIQEIIDKTTQVVIEAIQYSNYPFESLIDWLDRRNLLDNASLFNVMYDFQVEEIDTESELIGAKPLFVHTKIAKLPLCFHVTKQGEDFIVAVEYQNDIYQDKLIETLLESYLMIVSQTVEASDKTFSDMKLMNKKHRQRIQTFSISKKTELQCSTIDKYFYASAKKYETKTAVHYISETGELKLSYKELMDEVEKAVCFLARFKLQKGESIGLLFDNSFVALQLMLASARLGIIYVPIGLNYYPDEFISTIIEAAEIKIVFTDQSHYLDLQVDSCVEYVDKINVDTQKSGAIKKKYGNILPSDSLYTIFTSGTTGKPKGVLVTHENLCSVIQASSKKIGLDSTAIGIQFSSFSFDMSVWEIFTVLLNGGELVLLNAQNPKRKRLQEMLQEYKINYATLTPSIIRTLKSERLPYLQKVISAGEKLEVNLIKKWQTKQLFNAYGPTETTICATIGEISEYKASHVGSPLENVDCFILDEHFEVLTEYMIGELYIGGKGVSSGYLNNYEKNQDRFQEIDIFEEKHRVYVTGDLCYWNKDGQIEVIGRADNQIKIRGFRVELEFINSEVEKVAVFKKTVTIYDEETGIVSFIETGEEIDEQLIRNEVKKKIPSYMVPAQIFTILKFPVSKGGKLDRQKLTQIAQENQNKSSINSKEPRIYQEKKLLDIWKEVLGKDQISIEDNFFEIGGHSLNAIQIISLASEAQLVVEIEDLLELGTIKGISEAKKWIANK